MKLQRIIIAFASLCLFFSQTLFAQGGVFTLYTLKNKDRSSEVCLVGMHPCIETKQSSLLNNDEADKKIVLEYLTNWSNQSEKVVVYYPGIKENFLNVTFEETLEIKPLQNVLKIMASKAAKNAQGQIEGVYDKNLSFLFDEKELYPKTHPFKALSTLITFLADGDLRQLAMLLKLQQPIKALGINPTFTAQFRHEGKFQELKTFLKTLFGNSSFTINEFLEHNDMLLQNIFEEMQGAQKQVKLLLHTAYKTYVEIGEKIRTLCKQHNAETTIDFLDLIVALMDEQNSYVRPLETFKTIVKEIGAYLEIKTVLNIIRATEHNKYVCCFPFIHQSEILFNILLDLEFTGKRFGIDLKKDERIVMENRAFTDQQLHNFFSRVFTAEQSELLRLRILTQPFKFLNPLSRKIQDGPVLDHTLSPCVSCKENKEKQQAFVLTSTSELYCSFDCYAKQLSTSGAQARLFQIIMSSKPLSDGNKEFIGHIGCFIYYTLLTLASATEHSIAYTLDHKALSDLFTTFSQSKEHASIKKCLRLLGIDPAALADFFKQYAYQKKQYQKECTHLVKTKRKVSYEELTDRFFPRFNEMMLRTITLHQQTIIANLSVDAKTNDFHIYNFFTKLLKLIEHKLSTHERSYEEILKGLCQTKQINPPEQKITQSVSYVYEDEEGSADKKASETTAVPLQPSEPFIQVSRKPFSHEMRLTDSFLKMPYTITLYKTRDYIKDPLLKEAHTQFKKCTTFKDAHRIQYVFVLADLLESEQIATLQTDDKKLPYFITQRSIPYDTSFIAKLNLDHLFTRKVDHYLKKGIVQNVNDLIQVSIPGEIRDHTGKLHIGFFQYSFIPESWTCIHRCFAHYSAKTEYVNDVLRRALLTYLKEFKSNDEAYTKAINDLSNLIL